MEDRIVSATVLVAWLATVTIGLVLVAVDPTHAINHAMAAALAAYFAGRN